MMQQDRLRRRTLLAGVGALAAPVIAHGQSRPAIRLGVLTDLSGQYRDNSGPTTVLAVRQAVEDFAPEQHGFAAEVVSADHGQKPDLGAAIVRQWFDREGVDVAVDLNNTAVALAAGTVAREKDKLLLISGAASSELTGKYCSPNAIHWANDSYAGPNAVGSALLKAGKKRWFLVVADYLFGHSLENNITNLIKASGGTLVGQIAFPFPGTTDFSSFLVQAQASGADVLGLCCTGGDMEACVKQAREFGLHRSMQIAAMLGFITEVHALGLEAAQGLLIAQPFYWDLNDRTRAFAKRFVPKTPTNWPSNIHAAGYSATTHYLRTVVAMGVEKAKASGRATVAAMKAAPTDDDCYGTASIRPDGRFAPPVQLFQVKAPADSRSAWDLFTRLDTIPPDQAWHPPDPACPLVTG